MHNKNDMSQMLNFTQLLKIKILWKCVWVNLKNNHNISVSVIFRCRLKLIRNMWERIIRLWKRWCSEVFIVIFIKTKFKKIKKNHALRMHCENFPTVRVWCSSWIISMIVSTNLCICIYSVILLVYVIILISLYLAFNSYN